MYEDLTTTNTILYCREWDATVRFYRDGLRLPVVFATDWFVEFRLTATSRLSIADEEHASIKSCGNAGITVSLQVKDIDAAREHAQRMGLRPTEVKEHPWDARVFHLFDPEGHRIEIWQSSKTSPID
jgi:catechol 2,3-dioxygenase-like lactoylglutathione lyase family enzyme